MVDFALLAAIWGSSFLFMRLGVTEFGALPTAAVRVAVAAAFLLPLLWWRGLAPQLARHWKPVIVIGVLNSGIPFAGFAFALLSITTGMSAILNATVPLFGALIARVWLGDRIAPSRVLGLAVGFGWHRNAADAHLTGFTFDGADYIVISFADSVDPIQPRVLEDAA